MKTKRTNKVLTMSVLCVAVLALAVGFAAFSNTLTISSSANVTPNANTFNVDFSTSSSSVVGGTVTPVKSPTDATFTVGSATIDNSGAPTLTGLSAEFTEPGQSVTYNLYAYNAGEFLAYLNGIVFNGEKKCTPGTGTTASYVTAACEGITLSVKVGSDSAVTETKTGITNHTLATTTGEAVQVVISYDEGSAIADGSFTVKLPDISLVYSTTSSYEVPTVAKVCTYQGTDESEKYEYGAEYSCTLADGTPRTFYVLEDGDDTTLNKGTTGSAGTDEVALIMDRNFTDNTVPSTLAWCIDNGNDAATCQSINSKEEGTPLKHIQDTFGNDVMVSFPTVEQIAKASNQTFTNEYIEGLEPWLYDYLNGTTNSVSGVFGYWTATPSGSYATWQVDYDGMVSDYYGCDNSDSYGVRPVIIVSKEQI